MAKTAKVKAGPTGAEVCYGCGAVAAPEQRIVNGEVVTVAEHPFVGILNSKDVEKEGGLKAHGAKAAPGPGEDGETYAQVPVCRPCHVDPAHRTVHALKCHFFERKASRLGLAMAGSLDLQA